MVKLLLVSLLLLPALHAQNLKENSVMHAKGTFEVKIAPGGAAGDPTIQSLGLDKQVHGGLEGTTKGTMLAVGDPKSGSGGYVAMERVTATLNGKTGTFALMHWGTMKPGSPYDMRIAVVPGSGTGELQGISGTFVITIDSAGKHTYTFDYTFEK